MQKTFSVDPSFCLQAHEFLGSSCEDLKNFNLMVDSIDDVLEKVDTNLRRDCALPPKQRQNGC